jgi:hypothetical protein
MLSLDNARNVIHDDGWLHNCEGVDVGIWALPLKVAAIPVVIRRRLPVERRIVIEVRAASATVVRID